MTAFAFILGVVPLVIATGPGAEMRQALGTAVFFGMIGATVFGLFLTPVFYVVIRAIVMRVRGESWHAPDAPTASRRTGSRPRPAQPEAGRALTPARPSRQSFGRPIVVEVRPCAP